MYNFHEKYIKIAYKQALKVKGFTNPNPAVGAVIVKKSKIISKGATGKPGEFHAEVQAIQKCKENIKNSTMYVTLEPCNTYGRTPPCTKAIIDAGIKEVIIGTKDPNPNVSGKGIKELENAGIKTTTGFYKKKLIELNEDYFKYISTGLPFVAIKYAQTLDGKIAANSGDSKWITNEKSRKFVHKLRGIYDAILVGSGTVVKDNPMLTVRTNKLPSPIRIVIDPNGVTPEKSNVFNDEHRTIFIITENTPKIFIDKIKNRFNKEVLLVKGEEKNINLKHLLLELASLNITSLLVEGGQRVISSFLEQKLFDKLYAFIAPKLLISGLSPTLGKPSQKISNAINLKFINQKKFLDDVLITGYFIYPGEYLDI